MIRPVYSEEDRKTIARKVLDRRWDFIMRSGFLDYIKNCEKWDVQWRACMTRSKRPWPHASDYNPPMTFSKVEDTHAILFGAIRSFEYFGFASAGRRDLSQEMLRQRAQDLTDTIRWSMQNESNAIAFLDEFVHNGCLFGSGVGYLPWIRQIQKMRTELYIPDEIRQDKGATDLQILKASLGANLLKTPKRRDEDSYDIYFRDDDGQEKDARAWIDRNHPFRPEGEATVILDRDLVIYNAPRPLIKSPWDFMVPADGRDPQTVRRFWVREYMDTDEIANLHRIGVFNTMSDTDMTNVRADDARRIPASSSPGVGGFDAVEFRRDVDLGLAKLRTRSDTHEILFEYAYEDLDEDGYSESIVRAVFAYPHPTLLMEQRIEYLFPHGRRPFFDWRLIPVDGRYYGMGIPELLERSQIEENAFYQTRSDVLEIVTKPGGMYDPMSLSPKEVAYRPGMWIKARDPQTAVREWNFPVDPGLLLREQSGIEMQSERAVGSTDMGLGRGPSRPNAPRTLGGTAIMVRQQQVRMDVYMARLMYGTGVTQGGLSEFCQQYKDLYVALMPEEKEIRAFGTDDLRVVQRADLQGRFDFVADLGQETNNPQLRMNNAIMRYQTLANEPMIMQNPFARWQLVVDVMEATGMKNASRFLPSPSGSGNHPPMKQEEENEALSKGIWVDVLPGDNHAEHLMAIYQVIQDQVSLAQQFGPNELQLLDRHAQRHVELFQQAQTQGIAVQPGGNGSQAGPEQRPPRVQAAMTGLGRPQEPVAGPVEADMESQMMP